VATLDEIGNGTNSQAKEEDFFWPNKTTAYA
jgi:hypothetical protein